MLDDAIRTQLTTYLGMLREPIELVASLDDSDASRDVRALLQELAAASSRVTVREDGDAPRRPSFTVARPGEPGRLHFAGLPLGHEFTSLVLALLHTGGHPPKVSGETLDRVRRLEGPHRAEVFVSLACHNCPDVVQAFNLIAAHNPAFEATMVDGGVHRSEVEARGVMAVPAVFLDGEPFGQGRMSLEEILDKLDTAGKTEEAARLSAKEPFDVLVVGGGPAGAAAAIYAARKGIRTGVVAERFGGQLLDTVGIENFISVPHTEGERLARSLEEHVKTYEVDVMYAQRAEALIPGAGLHELRLAEGATLRARTVILATGARWRELQVPGEAAYRTKGVTFCPHCDGPLFQGKRVAVIGGGNSGVEAAIDLAGIVAHVTLLEFGGELRADAVLQQKLRSLANVTVLQNAQTTEVLGNGSHVTGLAYTDRTSNTSHALDLDGVFVQIGLLPNTAWLGDTLKLSRYGEIEVDVRGQTSVPGVFAAGDCTTVPYKQIIVAMGEGTKASLAAFDHLIRSSVPEAN
ncbi:MAG: alkyl hydroperoxide reductase subunit F [Candidatus Sericytochromatia bacterium]|nr:alkyl hydroperoxide reductase subunit F [Candidatus Sericytochromatia bacterium]